MYENLASLAAFAFLFSVISGRIERSTITGPIIFIAFGLIAGPFGLGFLNIEVKAVELRVVADLTLALVLFIDAANADLSTLRSHARIPFRMLLIGLPLSIALGAGVGMVVFPDIALFELWILATMLAATDAALGKGVVTNRAVPARIREGLNVESGLNDGLCVPVLLVFLALATGASGESGSSGLALKLVAEEIGIGLGVAVVMTLVGVKLISICAQRDWFTDVWKQIPVVTLALACFARVVGVVFLGEPRTEPNPRQRTDQQRNHDRDLHMPPQEMRAPGGSQEDRRVYEIGADQDEQTEFRDQEQHSHQYRWPIQFPNRRT